ncbi:golgin subfamily A member 4 isoform X2 [Dunckerocampus dactyliophorus]|uniref:golgin subfamily A member 4 isoform X2 n=1 Tax=Dunckerocampus dactyliophorus TaxID=161453 RepID=UPI002406ED2A|nr:golgin subfamily A member 4 isoform X2 [Dunckerocampus dactyliophorus]
MFKKLKQKINEEQSPQRNAQTHPQAQVGSVDRRSSQTPPFGHDGAPSPSDREQSLIADTEKSQVLAGMIAEPAFLSEYTIFALDHSKRPKTAQVASVSASKGPNRSPRGSINGDESASPHREEPQSFAQKLQLKVPSMESLIRGGASRAEHLFRSPSKESLVRSASRESLTHLGENEATGTPTYDPPSDIESEAEESPGSAEALSKEQLLHRLVRVEASLGKYRGKYSELVTAYRTVQRDKEKTQAILSQSQDKALRRIGELREELQMDQQAKKHLQDEFDAALEEKDQMITVLQTQVALLKKRLKGVSDGTLAHESEHLGREDADSASDSPLKDHEVEPEVHEEGVSDPTKVMEALQQRVKRQENLLHKYKEVMRTYKERSSQLGSENETLQEQLQERLQDLERMKELHTTEKTKLINQLRDVKNQNEQLEQDKGMVIAETKRQMHETLEMKEEEVAQLRSRLQLANCQNEELQEQKEKAEKSAFEELERALSSAQKTEEARKQLQVQMEDQMREAERVNEEERKSLQQELTRVKQEVVTIMKKSSEERMAEMEKAHCEALDAKEEELSARISTAVEQCKAEFAQLTKEREQQASLALEDAELQKTALITEADNKLQEMQQQLEAARTRIMELESSLEKSSQDESSLSHEHSIQLDQLEDKHKEQMSTLKAEHQAQLEKHKDTLTQQHNAALEELKEKQRVELETFLKDKDLQIQIHTENVNQKLNAKQAEQEALSAELSEVLKSKQLLEVKLVEVQNEHCLALQDQVAKHSAEIVNIKQEHEQSLGGMEKTLKEELNALKIVLREKEKEIEELTQAETTLKQESHSNLQELNDKAKQLEDLRQSLSHLQLENSSFKEASNKISDDLVQSKKNVADFQDQLEVAKNDRQQKELLLQELEQQLQQSKKELAEQAKSHATELNTKHEEHTRLQKQLDDEKIAHEKKLKNTTTEMEAKLKTQETKMDKYRQKTKEMQDNFKKKLQQKEESMKKELAKKDTELQQKEQLVQEKILEMAQTNSQGLSNAVSELQANHLAEVEKLRDTHKREILDLEHHLQEKLGQQEEELMEKHSQTLQEKTQELEECSLKLTRSTEENEHVLATMKKMNEELVLQETTVQKLKEELDKAVVKIESLSTCEVLLREQMQSVERNLSQTVNERDSLQDKLNMTEEESREKLKTLSDKMEETEKQLQAFEGSRQKDMQNKSEEAAIKMKAMEAQFQQQLNMISNQMQHYCKDIHANVVDRTSKLCQRVELSVSVLQERLLCNQKKIMHLKNVVSSKIDKVCTLEENLRQKTEENNNLCISVEQVTAQVNAHMEQIKALTHENEKNSLSISEKAQKIEELSELNGVISVGLKENELQVSNLESIISDLKHQLEGNLKEKEEAILGLKQQHEEERQKALAQTEETIQRLKQERASASEQADALRASLSENVNNAASLKTRMEELERVISEKNEALQRLTTSFDNQSISKSEMDQVLSEKEQKVSGLTAELEGCNHRLNELQEQLDCKVEECEQLARDLKQQHNIRENERKELVEKLQQNSNSEQEMVKRLHHLEEDNQKCKSQLQSRQEEFEKLKDEMMRSKEEGLKETERLTTESARKVSELKKKAEQKIAQIKKQLTSQLEEKEEIIMTLQASQEELKRNETSSKECIHTLEEKTKSLGELLVKLKEEQASQLADERQTMEKSLDELRSTYEEKLSSEILSDSLHQTELRQAEAFQEVESKLKEAERKNGELFEEINTLKEEIRQKDVQCNQHQAALMQAQTSFEPDGKIECSSLQQANSMLENEVKNHPAEPDGDSFDSLKSKLNQMKNEKEKIHKDFTRLQKDIRSMRKEHEQDLEYVKKQLSAESEEKFRLELEDTEMKHKSEIKQLIREFNTQLAVKEKEIDTAVKEAIAKAQIVEAELISSHQEETIQLQKVVSQREEDLNRTVQKYEHVIQSREEEMGTRVWQVQKELEELRARSLGTSEMSTEELQVQLAEKTTLLSEARLKEQGFVERIHSLEDKIKCFHRNAVVTHLGSTHRDAARNKPEPLSEATEMEYLRKVLFEYMMGRETKTMAKVITSMLKFPPDQAQKVLDKEESKVMPWLSV